MVSKETKTFFEKKSTRIPKAKADEQEEAGNNGTKNKNIMQK